LLPCIIAGFLAGPVGGVVTVLIKTLVKLPLSKTMYVGEISDLVIGIIVVLVCSVIYKVIHSKKGAVIALIAGTATWLIVAVLANYLFVIPLYIKLFYGGDTAPLITMMEVIPGINESNYMVKYLFIACLPFNALLAIVSNGVTLIVYKRISKIFDSIEGIEDEETSIT
jgi:riboflavin transporter FmnP